MTIGSNWRMRNSGGRLQVTISPYQFAPSPDATLPLWRFQMDAPIDSSPMSYAAQFVALSAGSVLYSFALPQMP